MRPHEAGVGELKYKRGGIGQEHRKKGSEEKGSTRLSIPFGQVLWSRMAAVSEDSLALDRGKMTQCPRKDILRGGGGREAPSEANAGLAMPSSPGLCLQPR